MNNILKLYLFIAYFFCMCVINAQEFRKINELRLGINYNVGSNNNLFFDNKNYKYTSQIINIEWNYLIKKGKINYEFLIGPSYNEAKHTLLNKYFISPDESDYLLKIEEFTKEKIIRNYILNIGILAYKNIGKNCNIYFIGSIGPNYNDTATERLAKGFAFLDNISLGFSYLISNSISLDIRESLKHISNAGFYIPNGGYTFLAFGIGASIRL